MEKEELIARVRDARARLQLAVAEFDDVNLREARALRVKYTSEIGQYEFAQYELYLRVQELKQKIEMIQARLNRGEPVDIDAINDAAESILEEYYQKLNGMRSRVEEMEAVENGERVGIFERSEIKKIYRHLMKMLHPDVCGGTREPDPVLWEKVRKAYQDNDLATLQMLEDLVGEIMDTPLEKLDEAALLEMKARMERSIVKYQLKLVQIRKSFPFTEEEHLKDAVWVRKRRQELEASIAEYCKAVRFLEKAYDSLVQGLS